MTDNEKKSAGSEGNEPRKVPSLDDSPSQADAILFAQRDSLRRMISMRLDPAIAPREDASDIVQNVMIEAHRRLGDYLKNPVMPFHLWLRHIALDHIIEAHRRHRGAQRRSLDREQPLQGTKSPNDSSGDMVIPIADKGMTPASAAIKAEIRTTLEDAMELLAPDDRSVLQLRHKDMLTNQEAARLLGLTEAAASMRYLRAIRRLKEILVGPESQPSPE